MEHKQETLIRKSAVFISKQVTEDIQPLSSQRFPLVGLLECKCVMSSNLFLKATLLVVAGVSDLRRWSNGRNIELSVVQILYSSCLQTLKKPQCHLLYLLSKGDI